MDPLQQNAPKEIVQRVEAIERRVGGLEVEMSKVPPVLALLFGFAKRGGSFGEAGGTPLPIGPAWANGSGECASLDTGGGTKARRDRPGTTEVGWTG